MMVLSQSFLDISIAIILGLVLGSFATALIHRVPAGVSWSSFLRSDRRSACPQCKAVLSVFDLVPVFSWLFLRGRCRRCAAPIGVVYPLTELAVMLACLAYVVLKGGEPWILRAWFLAAAPFLAALFVIDLRSKILPNPLVLVLAILGLGRLIVTTLMAEYPSFPIIEYLGGAFFFGGAALVLAIIMGKILGKPALGGGDVKFMAVCGLWLGMANLPGFLILSGVLGIGLGALWKLRYGPGSFPFGPALIVAFFVLLLH